MVDKKYVQWLLSDDTGVSSETMLCAHIGVKRRRNDAPYDPADFGRCYRLLKKFPEIRDSFSKIGRRVKAFKGILKEWDRLVVIYERDLESGKSAELYAEIKRLRRGDLD